MTYSSSVMGRLGSSRALIGTLKSTRLNILFENSMPISVHSLPTKPNLVKATFVLTLFCICNGYNTLGTTCQFPAHWTGFWFQKGYRDPINIKNGVMSSKGVCRKISGDKFLVESKTDSCFRCVVIHERHENVLQYKETYCSPTSDLEEKCGEISGDALLHSMFRMNTTPVPCPFEGFYTFSYNRGHGECTHPVSTVDSCTDDSHLFFKFQACTNVRNSESREEKMTCIATWKEGSTRYLIAKMEHKDTITEEDKFRCLVYDKLKNESGYQIAQSGDATCDGLFSATEGSRTMTLIKSGSFSGAKCRFPKWFTKHSFWQSLDGTKFYSTDNSLKSFQLSNSSKMSDSIRVACNRIRQLHDSLYEITVYEVSGCLFGNRGYKCMRIHKRTPHVVEIQMGKQVLHAYEACTDETFDSSGEFVTLTTKIPSTAGCPLIGVYKIKESKPQFSELVISDSNDHLCTEWSVLSAACNKYDTLDFQMKCSSETRVKSFQCHGSWEQNGTQYLIVSVPDTREQYCMAFTEEDKVKYFSSSAQTCVQTLNLYNSGNKVFSITDKGGCSEADGGEPAKPPCIHLLVVLLSIHFMTTITVHNSDGGDI